jgi:asparagine synthase (glutamine-hydrolysing)
MSGIVGIITFDGQPLDEQLLRTITESMKFRGPDACEILSSANFGFGHTLLGTSSESTGEKQPLNLNQKVWLTADARIDGRAELIAKLSELNAHERSQYENCSDAELILNAYLAWGQECVAHLIGDFSFAILDLKTQRLFCARDHLGIKPFYYARPAKTFIFSNTLESIQLHPEVTKRLNDQAIGDLLLFDFNRDPNRTSFQDISRLPPAHTLTLDLTTGECRIKRYWSSPEAVTLRYRNQSEYLEHFQDLFTRAVEDRIRTNRLQSFLSGGLDSTGIASEVVRIRQRLNRDLSLTGQCVVYRELMDDQEGHFASIAAEALGIPLYYVVADPYLLYEDAGAPELLKPEPVHEPLQKLTYHQFSKIQADCRVALSGLGPDATMSFWLHSHIASMKSNSRLAELTMDLIRYFWLKRRPPRLHVLDRLGRTPGPQTLSDTYPRWLNKKFEERLELNNREVLLQSKEMGSHFRRKQAFQLLSDPGNWTYHFEYADSGTTRLPVEVRYPYFDVRLVSYLMSIPAIPWCVDKRLLRETLKESLPAEIYKRPKTPLVADPFTRRIERGEDPWSKMESVHESLSGYVDLKQFRSCVADGSENLWVDMRPISLNLWLQHKE